MCKQCYDKVHHPKTQELQRHCDHHATAFSICRFCTKAYPYAVSVAGEQEMVEYVPACSLLLSYRYSACNR